MTETESVPEMENRATTRTMNRATPRISWYREFADWNDGESCSHVRTVRPDAAEPAECGCNATCNCRGIAGVLQEQDEARHGLHAEQGCASARLMVTEISSTSAIPDELVPTIVKLSVLTPPPLLKAKRDSVRPGARFSFRRQPCTDEDRA